MARESEFVAYLLELLDGFGEIAVKRMFGGHGIYRNGLMFGLVDEDTLFLKADEKSRPLFERRGLPPFTYLRKGQPCALSYFQAPAEALEARDEMQCWAMEAFAAARRAAAKR